MRLGVIGMVLGMGLALPAAAQGTNPAPATQAEAPAATGPLSASEIRALLDSARETAKATRESVDYARVVPDILQQILTKLDKLEDKLDKVENAVKAQRKR